MSGRQRVEAMREYGQRPEVKARQRMLRRARIKDDPRNHHCLCGNVAVEYDQTSNSWRCAFCRWCEGQNWPKTDGHGSHIMPYRLNLNLNSL